MPGREEVSQCEETEVGSRGRQALVQLPGRGGSSGGPGKASSPWQPDWSVPPSLAPSSTRQDAVALKAGRTEVPLWCELKQIIHFSECRISQL